MDSQQPLKLYPQRQAALKLQTGEIVTGPTHCQAYGELEQAKIPAEHVVDWGLLVNGEFLSQKLETC